MVHPMRSNDVVMIQYAEDWLRLLKIVPTPICHGPHDCVRRKLARLDLARTQPAIDTYKD